MRANIPPRKSKLPRVPILEILKTKGFLAFLLGHLGSMWGNFTMWTSIPLYLNNIQHFSLKAVRRALNLFSIFKIKSYEYLEWWILSSSLPMCVPHVLSSQLHSWPLAQQETLEPHQYKASHGPDWSWRTIHYVYSSGICRLWQHSGNHCSLCCAVFISREICWPCTGTEMKGTLQINWLWAQSLRTCLIRSTRFAQAE